MSEELKPCPLPWCRSNTHPEEGTNRLPFHTARDRWHVACPYCATRGPTCKTHDEAIAAWNRRSPPAKPADGMREACIIIRDLVGECVPSFMERTPAQDELLERAQCFLLSTAQGEA